MNEKKEVMKKGNSKSKFLRRYFTNKVFIGIVIVLVIVIGPTSLKKLVWSESKTTKIGFEDIGELATQSAYCTEVNVTDASRELFGLTIPFTQSKYIYSYDVVIKAGFNFEEIEWTENGTTIEVKLPEVRILSSDIDMDSFKLYYEDESIFRQITMTENNDAMKKIKKTAEEDAIANGILNNARSNAETILTGFFGNVYDLGKYEITFIDK